MTLRRGLFVVAALCALAPLQAQERVLVTSPRADSVSLTVYRDDLALVTETRTVDLPAEPATLVLDQVVDTLLPQSAVLIGAERPLAESNFDFDRLTPMSLIKRSVGKPIVITRTNPKTGRVTRVPATIVAAVGGDVLSAGSGGVVLQTADGNEAVYCSGLPSQLEFREVPADLHAKPQLSVQLAAGVAGSRTITVSYLAHGFGWSSDYVARLNEASDRMHLAGWMTLVNSTGTSFEQAQVQVVAGALNVLSPRQGGSLSADVDDLGPRRRQDPQALAEVRRYRRMEANQNLGADSDRVFGGCYNVDPKYAARLKEQPLATPMLMRMSVDSKSLSEVVVSGARIAEREELGDYQLYRLPWLTDLGARQTKQVAFLDKDSVRVERFYAYRLADLESGPDDDDVSPNLTVRFENTESAGLGEPLPSGTVRVFEPFASGEVFAGDARIEDKPVGLPVELTIGRALNVALEITTGAEVSKGPRAARRVTVTLEHRVVNNKAVPVDVEIRHGVQSEWTSPRLRKSSLRERHKFGDFAWRFTVPANGVEELTYQLAATQQP